MSKADDATTLNVQGSPVEGRVLTEVPINRIIPDPDRPNVRGRVLDTTDIQPSIRKHGILQPILVRPVPDKPGYFYRISGERRQVAAREVGLTVVPVIVGEDLHERDVRKIMLASDLHKKEPHVVLDRDDNVIAGKCKAVYEEMTDEETETTRRELALSMGVSPDIVGAYFMLHQDIAEVHRKVANGQLAITVYSLMKHHEPDVKRRLVRKRGEITARYIRDAFKNWDDFVAKQDAKEQAAVKSGIEEDVSPEPQAIIEEPLIATALLNGALDKLNRITVNSVQLSGTDWAIVEQIYSIVEKIQNEK